jgi:hypothetical protein
MPQVTTYGVPTAVGRDRGSPTVDRGIERVSAVRRHWGNPFVPYNLACIIPVSETGVNEGGVILTGV